MSRLVVRLVALLSRLGLRWMVIGAAGRFLARRLGRTTIDRATADVEEAARRRLPDPVADVVTSLPPEAKRAAGSALVAARVARGGYGASRRAGRAAVGGSRRASSGLDSARGFVATVEHERRSGFRRLRARYLAAAVGPEAATDALLDIRRHHHVATADAVAADERLDAEPAPDPHEQVPPPVPTGRRRHRRPVRTEVARVRRSYRRPTTAWDD